MVPVLVFIGVLIGAAAKMAEAHAAGDAVAYDDALMEAEEALKAERDRRKFG
jgi:hypothetical protein